jgi:hypothetical protein
VSFLDISLLPTCKTSDEALSNFLKKRVAIEAGPSVVETHFFNIFQIKKSTKSVTKERCDCEATLGHPMAHREQSFFWAGDFHCRLRKYGRL